MGLPIVFHPREILLGWKHLFLGMRRRLLKQSPTAYLPAMNAPGYTVSHADAADGSKLNCPVCGFAMATLGSKDSWQIETCSAFPVARPGSPAFDAWFALLQTAELPEKTTTKAAR